MGIEDALWCSSVRALILKSFVALTCCPPVRVHQPFVLCVYTVALHGATTDFSVKNTNDHVGQYVELTPHIHYYTEVL